MAEETILFNGETESVSLIPNSEMSLRNVASVDSDDSEQEIFRAQNFGGDKHLLEEEIENEEVEEGRYDYERALKFVGFGPFHFIILFATGLALASDAVEVLAVSYVLESSGNDWGYDSTGNPPLSKSQKTAISLITFVGMMFGGYVWGTLSDLTGRRKTLIVSLLVNGLAGLFAAFWRNYYYFLLLRFISGIGVGGSIPIVFAYQSEFIEKGKRAKYLAGLSSFWIVGQIFTSSVGWIIIPHPTNNNNFLSWQVFLLIAAVPSLLSATLYMFLPESPKMLQQTGKLDKAIQVLQKIHKWNAILMCNEVKELKVKSLTLEVKDEADLALPSCMAYGGLCMKIPIKIRKALWRTCLLFKKKYLVRTLIFLWVYLCLSFGSYGITIWYPSYVKYLDTVEKLNEVSFCPTSIYNASMSTANLPETCKCTSVSYFNTTFKDIHFSEVTFSNANYTMVTFENVKFNKIIFDDCTWENVTFINVTIENMLLKKTNTSGTIYSEADNEHQPLFASNCSVIQNVTVNSTNFDSMVVGWNRTVLNTTLRSRTPEDDCVTVSPKECGKVEVDENRIYREAFIFAASSIPGTIISAIVVDLPCMWRSLWLSIVFGSSAVSMFLLLINPIYLSVSAETFSVIILTIYNGVTISCWNTLTLLHVEIYPTPLRTTSGGVGSIAVRIGAIAGNTLFGAFQSNVSIAVPVVTVAALLVSALVVSLCLPKTTKRTQLE